MSADLTSWITVVDASLTDAIGKGCAIPLEAFAPTSQETGRFIRFTSKTHFGIGGAIQYITWDYTGSKSLSSLFLVLKLKHREDHTYSKLFLVDPLPRSIVYSDEPWSSSFVAENAIAIDDNCEAPQSASLTSYFLLKTSAVDQGFVVDAGSQMSFKRFFIRNTHNGANGNRYSAFR